jgi:hypothetical protein
MIKFGISSILSAFEPIAIGTRVTSSGDFLAVLDKAVEKHDTSQDRAPGQHFVMLPEEATAMVSSGVGRVSEDLDTAAFTLRKHRGAVNAYLRREHAEPATGVAAVVYTLDAYLADPDVDLSEESFGNDVTHVIVAVLAFAGPQSPLTPRTLVHNLAGGNREAFTWEADEIRSKAVEVNSYWSEWQVVADAEA